jgi:Flp pilus assembly protein TadD
LRLLSLAALFACAALAQHRAKIAVEGGTELPGTPLVSPRPPSQTVGQCIVLNVFGDGTVVYRVTWVQEHPIFPDGCRVTIRLTGYHALETTLTEGSTVVLKRLGDHEGSTVSLISVNAPKDARKAYERGLSAANHKKYEQAATAFEAAVAAYPQYAQAWSDLGQVQAELNRPRDARASWERAVQADPPYLKPYVQLARLAIAEGRNEEALAITSRGLEFNPVEFPAIYFYNAYANLNLKHYDAAEKSALATIAHDANHELPEAERLLGLLLASKGELGPASDHFRKYLALAPKAADAAVIRQKIAEIERRGLDQK